MNKFEYVYSNNKLIGNYNNKEYFSFDDEKKNTFINDLKETIIKNERNHKIISFVSGIFVLLCFITFTILMILNVINLGNSQWFFYIFFIALFILIWILLFNLLGLIFFKKINIVVHFKNPLSKSCITYASSNYYKWIDIYGNYLGKANLSNKNNEMIPYCLVMPSKFKNNIVYNRKIRLNVPYFYMVNKNIKYIFLPYFMIIINGKDSKVIEVNKINSEITNNKVVINYNNEIINEIISNGDFNFNFFNFKYEQN